MTDIEPIWRTSSFCSSAACVQIAETSNGVMVRDSKNPGRQPFAFTKAEWAAFVRGVQAGEFDHN